jgi:hypothetical protein
MAHCKATRSITLHTDLMDFASPLLDAMAGLPCLEFLGLSGYSSGPSIRMVLQRFAVPCLKSPKLSRYGISKGTDLGAPWPRDFSATQHDLEQLLPVANRPRFGFYSLARIAQLARRQLSYFS